jgi:hypothetical protein
VKKNTLVKSVIIILLLFFGAFSVHAQETIAIHPLDNNNPQMARIFIEELLNAIPFVPGYTGVYNTYLIDLVNNRPADVPPGGFPSYICPPASLTRGMPYAITGEVGEDAEYPGEYWVRLYLWRLDENQLLASDMVSASDRASAAENYPFVLAYLYSKIDEHIQQGRSSVNLPEIQFLPDREARRAPAGDYWLYLGLRAGAGNSTWKLDEEQKTPTNFMNFSGAFQIIGNVFYPLAIQTEANLYGHFPIAGEFGGEEYPIIWDITIPIFIKYNIYSGIFNASLYAGPWWAISLPMPQMTGYEGDWGPSWDSSLGVSYGITIGWRLTRRGTIFLDGRFSHLMGFDNSNVLYPFNGSTFSVGYEFGLISKRR